MCCIKFFRFYVKTKVYATWTYAVVHLHLVGKELHDTYVV